MIWHAPLKAGQEKANRFSCWFANFLNAKAVYIWWEGNNCCILSWFHFLLMNFTFSIGDTVYLVVCSWERIPCWLLVFSSQEVDIIAMLVLKAPSSMWFGRHFIQTFLWQNLDIYSYVKTHETARQHTIQKWFGRVHWTLHSPSIRNFLYSFKCALLWVWNMLHVCVSLNEF